DGEERVLFGRGETTRDESGKAIRHTGTSLDITEQHRAEAALRKSESRLKAILTAMDAERALIVTRAGIVHSTLSEPPTKKSHDGDGEGEIVGRSIHEFLPGEAGDRVFTAVKDVYATGGRSELEVSAGLPSGTSHFDISLRTLRSTSGGIESVLAIVRDVTQRKADALVLRQAQRLESLGVLAGGVAHDFNNLLVGVLGNAEFALDKLGATSSLRPVLEDIIRASTRAAELTRELLAYAGRAKLEADAVDVAALVEETARLVGPGIVDGVTIEVDCKPGSIWVHADATQIRQVVMNFIMNAADAMEGVGGRVEVRADAMYMDRLALERFTIHETLVPGDYALVEVSDRGVGMDRQTLDMIFDPFFTTKFQGRGLGLASTLGIVRAHGGAIHVESEPGLGSTFSMLLPRISSVPMMPSKPETDVHAGSETILVVDDEVVVRVAVRRMLELRGYHVFEATSGSRAVEVIRRGSAVDLALVDLTMPEMDGEQTFAALRALAPDMPVVFMSGHSREDVGLRVADKDRTAHITKPFRMSVLGETIAALLAPQE
ncbi:MAG: response regulator, partial [Myxococcota bacterium]